MEVMNLRQSLCLFIIIVLCQYVALESSETGEEDNVNSEEENVNSEEENVNSEEENVNSQEENFINSEEENNNLEENEPLQQSSQSTENSPATFDWPSGIVPYVIDQHYDDIIAGRIRAAMQTIESSSCVVFQDMEEKPPKGVQAFRPWLSIENPEGVRECSHTTLREERVSLLTKAILILGYDCMQRRDILHALLHALGLRDEVTHPQRDMYIRIIWENIQPKYRSLFWMRTGEPPHKTVEYDSMSIMHFHDRAYSINGGATILPLISGLVIAPSDKLSQLDVMKLQLAYGHDCNKHKVVKLLQTCHNVLKEDNDNNVDNDDNEEQGDEQGEEQDDEQGEEQGDEQGEEQGDEQGEEQDDEQGEEQGDEQGEEQGDEQDEEQDDEQYGEQDDEHREEQSAEQGDQSGEEPENSQDNYH